MIFLSKRKVKWKFNFPESIKIFLRSLEAYEHWLRWMTQIIEVHVQKLKSFRNEISLRQTSEFLFVNSLELRLCAEDCLEGKKYTVFILAEIQIWSPKVVSDASPLIVFNQISVCLWFLFLSHSDIDFPSSGNSSNISSCAPINK